MWEFILVNLPIGLERSKLIAAVDATDENNCREFRERRPKLILRYDKLCSKFARGIACVTTKNSELSKTSSIINSMAVGINVKLRTKMTDKNWFSPRIANASFYHSNIFSNFSRKMFATEIFRFLNYIQFVVMQVWFPWSVINCNDNNKI